MSDAHAPNLTALASEVASLRETVDKRLADDPVREAAFDKLYGELADYKNAFVAEAEKPLLKDLLLLYDSMSAFQRDLVHTDMGADTVADKFQFLVDELLEVLYRRDVVPMDATDTFDPTQHRAVQLQKASEADDDNRIAQVLKRGFLRDAKPLRPEEVVVYKWRGGGAS